MRGEKLYFGELFAAVLSAVTREIRLSAFDANAVSAKGAKSTDNDDAIIPEEKARKRSGRANKRTPVALRNYSSLKQTDKIKKQFYNFETINSYPRNVGWDVN